MSTSPQRTRENTTSRIYFYFNSFRSVLDDDPRRLKIGKIYFIEKQGDGGFQATSAWLVGRNYHLGE